MATNKKIQNLIRAFVKNVSADKTQTKNTNTVYGNVVTRGGMKQVLLDGGTEPTACAFNVEADDGDRVVCSVQNHSWSVDSNVTKPASSPTTVKGRSDVENIIDQHVISLSGIDVYYQQEQPTEPSAGFKDGDTWYELDANRDASKLHVWENGEWIDTQFDGGNIIRANSITSSKIAVDTLSAISADLGEITSGSINIGNGRFIVDTSGNVTAVNSAGSKLIISNSSFSISNKTTTINDSGIQYNGETNFPSGAIDTESEYTLKPSIFNFVRRDYLLAEDGTSELDAEAIFGISKGSLNYGVSQGLSDGMHRSASLLIEPSTIRLNTDGFRGSDINLTANNGPVNMEVTADSWTDSPNIDNFNINFKVRNHKVSIDSQYMYNNTAYLSTRSDIGFSHTHGTSGSRIAFGVGASGSNRGIYDGDLDAWMIYRKDKTTTVYFGGGLRPVTTAKYSLGDADHIWSNLYTEAMRLYRNTSYYYQFGGTPTANRTITFQNASGTVAFTSSDARLKRNIVDTDLSGLDMMNSIKVRQFDWLDNESAGYNKGRHQTIGFVADELEELDPFFIVNGSGGEDEDGNINPKCVDTFYMLGYMAKAIQELSTKVDELSR